MLEKEVEMNILDVISSSQYKDEDETPLPGFRFHPTDQELIGFYLRRKVEKKPMIKELIKQIDIYKYDPWDLPRGSTVGDNEWYFYCKRGRKYKNSVRPNRVTGSGFWKATGIDKPVYTVGSTNADNNHSRTSIGLKKSLVYYRGSAGKGTKTDWMMHEFRLPASDDPANNHLHRHDRAAAASPPHEQQEAEVWTLCRIFKRSTSYNKKYNNNALEVHHRRQQVPAYNKQIPIEACSATCSAESDDRSNCNGYISFESPSLISFQDDQQLQQENHQSLVSQFKPSISSYPNVEASSLAMSTTAPGMNMMTMTPSAMRFLTNEDWDELRSVVDQSLVSDGGPFHY